MLIHIIKVIMVDISKNFTDEDLGKLFGTSIQVTKKSWNSE